MLLQMENFTSSFSSGIDNTTFVYLSSYSDHDLKTLMPNNLSYWNETNCTIKYDSQLSEIWQVIVGTTIFLIILPLLYFNIAFIPIGPLAASLLGATLMVLSQVVNESDINVIFSSKYRLTPIFLVCVIMLFAVYSHRLGLINALIRRSLKPNCLTLSYLWRVSLISFILSAVFTLDATCTLYFPLVLKCWEDQDRSDVELETILLALSTSANLGSVVSIWGSVQMALLAASTANMPFEWNILHQRKCFVYLLPAAVLGWTVNLACLMLHYLANRKRFHKLRSASPSSLHGYSETPTTSRSNNMGIMYTIEKKANGYLNNGINEADSNDIHQNLLSDKDADNTPVKHVLETINEDEELQIIVPTPILRANEIETAPIAGNELIEDLDEESDFEKGEKLAALDLNSLDIVYKPGPLSNNVVGREVDADNDSEEMTMNLNRVTELNSLDLDYKPGALSSFRKEKLGQSLSNKVKSQVPSELSEGSLHSRDCFSSKSADSRKLNASTLLVGKQIPLGIPVWTTKKGSCIFYWYPTSISASDFLFGKDIPVQCDESLNKKRFFNIIFFLAYLIILVFACTTHISKIFAVDMGMYVTLIFRAIYCSTKLNFYLTISFSA